MKKVAVCFTGGQGSARMPYRPISSPACSTKEHLIYGKPNRSACWTI